MEIHFKMDADSVRDQLTWDDIEIIEGRNILKARAVLAKFAVDDKGNSLSYDKAMKLLGQTPLNGIAEVLNEFQKVFNDALLNPTSGGASNEPSKAAEAPPSGGNN